MTDSPSASSPFVKPRAPGTLKEASARLIKAVGVKRVADLIGKATSQVYRYTEDDKDAYMTVKAAADVLRAARASGSSEIGLVEYLAAECGCVVLRVTPLAGPKQLAEDVGRLGRETGEVFADYGVAAADGEIDDAERQVLLGDVRRIVAACMAIEADLTDGDPAAGGADGLHVVEGNAR